MQQSLVIRDKDLYVIAQSCQFPRRADEIWNRARRPVPNENGKTFAAKIPGHCASDDPKADHPNVFMRWIRHRCEALHGGGNSRSDCREKWREAMQNLVNEHRTSNAPRLGVSS